MMIDDNVVGAVVLACGGSFISVLIAVATLRQQIKSEKETVIMLNNTVTALQTSVIEIQTEVAVLVKLTNLRFPNGLNNFGSLGN